MPHLLDSRVRARATARRAISWVRALRPTRPYPVVARRNGYQGRVVVRLAVAADGRATGAEVLESSGYDVLDQSAVETLRAWKLEPALTAGKAVPGSVNVPVRFRLSG